MKCTRYISLMIALLSVLGIAAQQQQSQYALYNYRNDGDFNAWLNIDVDSITYSTIGLDSIEYDNIVTQEVWTPDSCYRIPIEAIDSIGFRAPEPEFKEGIFHITEEHLPFAVGVDGLTAIFDSSIPSSMLPSVGQVVISDVYDEPFEKGFAGRVVNIVSIYGTVRVECEAVGLEDVYDQLMFVGRCVVFEDDEVPTKNSSTSRKKSFIQIYGDGTWHVPLKKESFTIEDPDAYGNGRAYVGISFSPDLNIDYTIIYGIKGLDDKFKIIARPSVKIDLDYKLKYKKSLPPIEKIAPLFVPVPTPVPGLNCKIRFGAFLEAEGSVSVDGKLTYNIECSGGYDSSVNEDDGFVFSVDGGWGDPKFSVNIEGSLFCGPLIQVFTYLVYEKGFPCVKVNLKPGVDFTGKFVATTDAVSEYGFSAYDMLKESKLTISGKMKADASASFLGHSWECPWKPTIAPEGLKWDYYLFPAFTKPDHLFGTTALHSEVTRRTLFKPDLGLGVYDEAGNAIIETYSLLEYSDQSPVKTYIGHDMRYHSPGKYLVRPIVRNWFGEFQASPVAEVTVPAEPMSIEMNSPLNSVVLKKKQVASFAINGGWGKYSAISSNKAICTCEIKTINFKPFLRITASRDMTGNAVVTVRDILAGDTKTVFVTVSNDAVPEEFTLSEQTVSLQENETTSVLVTSGSGNYTAESSNENVATATVEDDMITITAISIGSATITVTDTETEETATIEVSVTESGGNDNGQELIVNGDFSSGNTGFTSDYIYASEPGDHAIWDEGTYAVGTSPCRYHSVLIDCGDHTTGTGNMLIANGSLDNTQYVWKQKVGVEAGKTYEFSAWFKAAISANTFRDDMEYSINGTVISGAYDKKENGWERYYGTYTATNSGQAEIRIRTMSETAETGNDFALDDISFKEWTSTSSPDDVYLKADEGTPGVISDESYATILDEKTSTKWCFQNNGQGYVIFHATQPLKVTGYKISTGNDTATYPVRNPKSWTLYGSTASSNPGKDGTSWEVIDTIVDDTKLQAENYKTYVYTLPSETVKAYRYFKWVITSPSGIVQVSEFRPTYSSAGGGAGGGGGNSW